jgi:hypothetical protein
VAWFGYRILEALNRHRPVAGAFWSLMVVPVGGPILLLLIVWVVNGFRKSTPEVEAATKTPTAMDALIKLTYGSSPPRKTANLREAIDLAFELLSKVVDIAEVQGIATGLTMAQCLTRHMT